ncbi:uncharacterized protein LOC122529571 [Frieseomelitta varia]|uniref:uncharacterized protein LOC122529571 n=1 Tax=Frieseomelitta varia TaxID=561572 RepID=UPI001CB68779|nr:uncharacterized protein LOC122529571 [Frieseomelitta varia]
MHMYQIAFIDLWNTMDFILRKIKSDSVEDCISPSFRTMRSTSPTETIRICYSSYTIKIKKAIFWTDFTIVLHWIHTQLSSLKILLENRTAEIKERTPPERWRHVPPESSPANAVSRGLLQTEITNQKI